ncbi:MAG: hypothetical protein KME17_04635 [Cyanosarcina radialis HA8281-LM2]|nr:hypothetical protein [Cyanosarcina radialis HA8281-LM2]
MTFPNFLRSLVLAIVMSFLAPTLLVAGLLTSLSVASYLPGIEIIGQTAIAQVLHFLATFGNGCPWEGILVIGLTWSFVGALFDTYAFYRYQSWRSN